MNVLVVDDEASVRQAVRRIVARDFNANVFEASDGLMALDYLLRERVDLAVIDLSMPRMNGQEVLEVIRRSPRYSTLPVLVLTASSSESDVRALVELGVTDYLLKPLSPAVFRNRVARVLRGAEATAQRRAVPARLELAPRSRVLVVDDNDELRRILVAELSRYCLVESYEASVDAFRASISGHSPAAVFISTTLQLFTAEMFAREARATAEFHATRIFALAPAHTIEDACAALCYDGVVVRSFVPETVRASLSQILSPATLTRTALDPDAPVVQSVLGAALQLLGTMIDGTVVAAVDPPAVVDQVRRWVVASVEGHTHELAWELQVTCPAATAARLHALRTHEESSAAFSEDQRALGNEPTCSLEAATLSALAEALGRTLNQAFVDRGLPSRCCPPRTDDLTSIGFPGEQRGLSIVGRWFRTADASLMLHVGLRRLEHTQPPDGPSRR